MLWRDVNSVMGSGAVSQSLPKPAHRGESLVSLVNGKLAPNFTQRWEVTLRPALSPLSAVPGRCPLLTSGQTEARSSDGDRALLYFGKHSNPQPPPHTSRISTAGTDPGAGKQPHFSDGATSTALAASSPPCKASSYAHRELQSAGVPAPALPSPFVGSSAACGARGALAWAHLEIGTSSHAGAQECCVHAPRPAKRSSSPPEEAQGARPALLGGRHAQRPRRGLRSALAEPEGKNSFKMKPLGKARGASPPTGSDLSALPFEQRGPPALSGCAGRVRRQLLAPTGRGRRQPARSRAS